jgi:hypothetical protein
MKQEVVAPGIVREDTNFLDHLRRLPSAPLPGQTVRHEQYRQRSYLDLLLPFLWAVLVAFTFPFGLHFWHTPYHYWGAGLLIFSGLFFLAGLTALFGTSLLQLVEEVTGKDPNGNGQDKALEPEHHLVVHASLNIPNEKGGWDILGLQVSAALQAYCRALRDHKPGAAFSESGSGEYLEVRDFHELRDALIDRHVIAWKNRGNPRSGYVFHNSFWHVINWVADLPLPQYE